MPQADPETGTVWFEYDGSRYEMVFDMKAIAFFEREADISIAEAFDEMQAARAAGKAPKLSQLAFLMQAGLRRHHPEVSAERAFRMANDAGVQAALGIAVKAASPDPRPAPKTAKPAKRSNSKSSSSPRSKRG